ncbi:ankyrin repeat domain-containing protein 53 [Ascaphus truei]|uniref:ankyrin repeat domain-containing protein 53 n=1 Tax=Ascaphus truei TaxID=8439 RepID=UPI003F59A054
MSDPHRPTGTASVGAQIKQNTVGEVNVERDQLTAAAIGNLNWLQLGLQLANSEVKTDRHGFSALHLAALHGRLQCLKLLVEDYKVNVDLPSHSGLRPIHLVLNQKIGSRALECLRYLIDHGSDVNVRSNSKVTPLHQASSEGLQDCVVTLVEAGADVHAKDSQGQKPIDLCQIWCHRACARYLRNAMWNRDKEDFARELKKMETMRNDLQENVQDTHLRTKKDQEFLRHMHFCDWIDEKGLPERLKKECRSQKGISKTWVPEEKSKYAHDHSKKSIVKHQRLEYNQHIKVSSSLIKPKINNKMDGSMTKAACREKGKGKPGLDKIDIEPKKSPDRKGSRTASHSWNTCVNPSMPPTSEIKRGSTVRLGTHDEEENTYDFNSYVFLTKDENGYPKIKMITGKVISPVPNLPYEVIQKTLFPHTVPRGRLNTPQDLKPSHVFDVPKKQPPPLGQEPVSEIPFHLRQNLDPKYCM